MALGRLFPESTRTLVWKAVTSTLRQSPALSGVKGWFLFEGDPKKDARELNQGDLPALRITLGCGPGRWIDEARHTTTLVFTHELAIAGSRQTDLIDFWAAVESAWFDGTNSLLDTVQPWLAWQKTITGPVPVVRAVDGALACCGTGVITVNMDLAT